jgi:Na+(H+)/acetate symporter ActP
MEKFAKLASLGALGVAGGVAVAYAGLLLMFRPVATGGMDHVGWRLVAVAILVPVAILAGMHVAFAKQLNDGPRPMHY